MRRAAWLDIGGMDDLSRLESPMHRVDPRAKALVTMAFIAFVMSYPRHSLSALMPWALYPVVVLALGRIPWRPIARKMLVAAPFALAVGMFNPLIDREPIAVLGPLTLSAGWMSFFSILARFALTVSAALALVACTGMYPLVAGLERLGLPSLFATQLLFLYRYLFVVAEEGTTMVRGVELRSGGLKSLTMGTYGSLLGNLLLRSMERADRVHRAMTARGFDGYVRIGRVQHFRAGDALFLAGWLAFFVVLRFADVSVVVGSAVTGGAR